MVGKSLVVQEGGLPLDDQPDFDPQPQQTAVKQQSSESRQRSGSDENVSAQFPLLQRIVEAFDQFHKRQILVACSDRDELLDDSAENSKQMTKLDFNLMEQRILYLACGTVHEIINELPVLSAETQIRIIKECMLDVSVVLKTYLSVKRFPNHGDPRMAVFNGYHADTSNCEAFLIGLPPEFIEKVKKIYDPLHERIRVSLDRLRYSKFSKVEHAALLAFCIYEQADKEEGDNRFAVYELRDRLTCELNGYLKQFYNSNEVCLRVSRLLSFIHDVKYCKQFYTDSYTLAGVFMAEYNTKLTEQPDVCDSYIKQIATSILELDIKK
ncbi:hypothetical protein M3Y97_00768800 [Aphelenchoides bicaudatus]|nr:hypothetical protein M3Y97_00768800 [Aphelenchoides bicaudatus]